MGAFLALAIVFSQFFHYSVSHQVKKETRTEQSEKKSGEAAHFDVLSSFSIPAPACIELDVDSFCLFEISFEKAQHADDLQETSHYTSKFLSTLFRVIISPNAP